MEIADKLLDGFLSYIGLHLSKEETLLHVVTLLQLVLPCTGELKDLGAKHRAHSKGLSTYIGISVTLRLWQDDTDGF